MLLPWYNNWNKDKGSRNKEMIRSNKFSSKFLFSDENMEI